MDGRLHAPDYDPVVFSFFTPAATPRVWSALTETAETGRYLYGLRLRSDWTVDAQIQVEHTSGSTLSGQVVCVRPGERVTYLLQATPDDPPVYLTWVLRRREDGTVVTLQVDEIEARDTPTEAEDVWLPVLAQLQGWLAEG